MGPSHASGRVGLSSIAHLAQRPTRPAVGRLRRQETSATDPASTVNRASQLTPNPGWPSLLGSTKPLSGKLHVVSCFLDSLRHLSLAAAADGLKPGQPFDEVTVNDLQNLLGRELSTIERFEGKLARPELSTKAMLSIADFQVRMAEDEVTDPLDRALLEAEVRVEEEQFHRAMKEAETDSQRELLTLQRTKKQLEATKAAEASAAEVMERRAPVLAELRTLAARINADPFASQLDAERVARAITQAETLGSCEDTLAKMVNEVKGITQRVNDGLSGKLKAEADAAALRFKQAQQALGVAPEEPGNSTTPVDSDIDADVMAEQKAIIDAMVAERRAR